MKVTNQLHPTPDQALAFFNDADDGPFVMINLVEFKEKAQYADGSDAHLSGQEAYMRYGVAMRAQVEAMGGKMGYVCLISGPMIREVEDLWDVGALAQYPTPSAMRAMMMSSAYQDISKHRDAGLAGQLNIKSKGL